jgi:hypothetical protein
MQSAKRSRVFEQPLERNAGGCAKTATALVLAELGGEQQGPAEPAENPTAKITRFSIDMRWYAYIM